MGLPGTVGMTPLSNPFMPKAPASGSATMPSASVAKPPVSSLASSAAAAIGNVGREATKRLNAPATKGEFEVPGAAEDYWRQNQGQFATPTAGENFWSRIQGGYGAPTASQQAFAGYNPQPTDLNGYYDNAEKNVTSAVNGQLAATGHYGSSAGAGLVGQAVGNLRADQAKEAADYDLKQHNLEGQLAGQADASQTARTAQYGNLANASGDSLIQRIMSGGQLANTAQSQEANRGQNMFDNILGATGMAQNVVGGGLNALLGQDSDLLASINNAHLGIGSEAQGVAQRNTELQGIQNAQTAQTASGILAALQQYANANRGASSFPEQVQRS